MEAQEGQAALLDSRFRCQHARIILLFGDSVWNPAVDPLVKGSGSITLRLWLRLGRRTPLPIGKLREAASSYGVPLCSLEEAAATGVLAEFGVPAQQVESVLTALGHPVTFVRPTC